MDQDDSAEYEDVFYVDIPTAECVGEDDGEWKHIASFSSKADAVAFIREHFGHCDDDGNICLITH